MKKYEVLPEVNFSDEGDVRYLHLGTDWVQGAMRLDAPYAIELEYVQRMMAGLLFVDPATVARRHAMQLGLGAAALTKFCRKILRMRTTTIELNPQVVAACRGWFKLPADDAKLRIIIADAAQEIRQPCWHGAVDVLQVDLYDHQAAAPVLDSLEFYADCRALLSEEGVMTVNLFGRSSSYTRSLKKICAAFGASRGVGAGAPAGKGEGAKNTKEAKAAGAVWAFRPTREGNTIVLAQRQAARPSRALLAARAQEIQSRWGLPAPKWLRVLKAVDP
ncbi:MAG: spermidine synthase [Burkholderiaceae bacterium]|nr:spermidine synthase [Burkholderiaceae bacterium]